MTLDFPEEYLLLTKEYAAWQDVVRLLLHCGAVTEEDCISPQSTNKTKGQQLFHVIRFWGDNLVALRKEQGS